jgi:4-hydroxybenzoate polyprenyltransferase
MPWLRLLRPHQWAKNALLGVPYLTAQAWQRPGAGILLALAVLAFSLVASATYILNDLADTAFDRAHAAKKSRPLAAGTVRPAPALALAAALVAAGLALGWRVGAPFVAVLLAYIAITTLYTRALKRRALLDVLGLGTLWVLRLVAGAAAIDVVLSAWLLSFGAFLFLSLSLVKRCAELHAAATPRGERLPGRGYRGEDLPMLQAWGVATGAVAVLVLALFVDSSSAQLRYARPEALWLVCPCLWFWLGRIWLKTGRNEMHHDPLVFSLRDPASWATLAAIAAVWIAAVVRL